MPEALNTGLQAAGRPATSTSGASLRQSADVDFPRATSNRLKTGITHAREVEAAIPAGHVETVLGDARPLRKKEQPNGFNVLALDAFSGDSIPVHLNTCEAMAIYRTPINDRGIIAFHVTNRFLSLAPLVEKLAADQGLFAALSHDEAINSLLCRTDWGLVLKDRTLLQQSAIKKRSESYC